MNYSNRYIVSLIILLILSGGCKKKSFQEDSSLEVMMLSAQATGSVTTYDAPANLPAAYRSGLFTVTADGLAVDLYNAGENFWDNPVVYGYFDIGGTATVTIEPGFAFSSYKIVPESLGIVGTRNGNTISFAMGGPANVSIVFNGDYHASTLHLFGRKPETNIPDTNDVDVLYYGPGYYDLSGQAPIQVASNQTLYIAGGAVIRGRVRSNSTTNVTIRGRGILLNDYESNDGYHDIALSLGYVSNSSVEDIIVNRYANNWTASMHQASFIEVKNYIAMSPWIASSDGFNINSSHDITFDSVFIRSGDDAVAIKGLSQQDPPNAPAVYNIIYKNSQLWSDANNAIGIGAETKASSFSNITFRNIDVLYNFDSPNYPDLFSDRSAINIFALHGTTFSDILFEDIRVEEAKRLINVQMDTTFYFGSLKGDWSWPGSMHDIHYKNIRSTSSGSNEIKLAGWDHDHPIYGVTFENVEINGTPVQHFNDPHFNINPYCFNLEIIAGGNTVSGDNYSAVSDYGKVQGKRNWYYRAWAAGVGTDDMVWNSDGSNHWRGPNTWDAIWRGNNRIILHPDNNQALLEWQATHDGLIQIDGVVRKSDVGGGDGVGVSVWRNNTMVWPANGVWHTLDYNDAVGIQTSAQVSVQAGDVVSFRVSQRSNSAYDSTAWDPTISYVQ